MFDISVITFGEWMMLAFYVLPALLILGIVSLFMKAITARLHSDPNAMMMGPLVADVTLLVTVVITAMTPVFNLLVVVMGIRKVARKLKARRH